MDVLYKQAWVGSSTDVSTSRHWISILTLSVLIHAIFILTIDFKITPAIQTIPKTGSPIVVNLEKYSAIPEQAKEISIQATDVKIKIPTVNEDVLKLENGSSERLNPPVHKEVAPNTTIIPGSSTDAEKKQITAHDLIAIAKEYVNTEANKEMLSEEKNNRMFMKSPSIMYGDAPDFFQQQEKFVLPEEQEELPKMLAASMRKGKEESLITPLEFEIGPLSCATLFVILGCSW